MHFPRDHVTGNPIITVTVRRRPVGCEAWLAIRRGATCGLSRRGGIHRPLGPELVEPPAEAVERDVVLLAELGLCQAAPAIAADDLGPVCRLLGTPGHHVVSRGGRDAMAQSSGCGDRVGRWSLPDAHFPSDSRRGMRHPSGPKRPAPRGHATIRRCSQPGRPRPNRSPLQSCKTGSSRPT